MRICLFRFVTRIPFYRISRHVHISEMNSKKTVQVMEKTFYSFKEYIHFFFGYVFEIISFRCWLSRTNICMIDIYNFSFKFSSTFISISWGILANFSLIASFSTCRGQEQCLKTFASIYPIRKSHRGSRIKGSSVKFELLLVKSVDWGTYFADCCENDMVYVWLRPVQIGKIFIVFLHFRA